MKNITTSVVFLLYSLFGLAQKKQVETNQFKLNILSPSVEYERGISKNQTLNFELGTGFALRVGSEIGTDFGFFPYIEGQYRYYYNIERRLHKGKKTNQNTANYLAASVMYLNGNSILGDLDLASNNSFFIGPLYGLQRTAKSGFNFGLEFGAGYYQNNVDGGISARLDFSIGWVLSKNK